jgi:hypothetical protein
MSYQMALCARVIKTGQLTAVLNFGITIDDFTSLEGKNLWSLLLSYYMQPETTGAVISPNVVQSWFKNFVLPDDMPSYPIEALCYQVRRERIITDSNALVMKYSDEVNIPTCNPAASLASLAQGVSSLIALGSTANTDVSFKQGVAAVRTKLRLMKSGVNFSKMQWPWEILNKATFGVQPDDYIVFYGRPKSMKTWVLCFLIAWAFENGKKVLVYTKEMTPDNMYARVLSCILQLTYDELRGATTSPEDDAAIDNLAATIEHDVHLSNLLTVLSGRDVPEGGDTVPWLQSKIDVYQPDLIFIDGLYLLSSQRKFTSDEGRVRGISRDLRAMNLSTGVPIIATMQANRKAAAHKDANLDEIAYSDALSQDCTIAARVINDKTSPTISVVIGGSREFKLHGFRINAVPSRDFSFHSILDEKEIQKAKEADQSEEEDKKKKEAANKKNGAKPEPKFVDRTEQLIDAQLRKL